MQNDDDWYLFDPLEVSDLNELYGKAFSERYAHYVAEAEAGRLNMFQKIGAREQFKAENIAAGCEGDVPPFLRVGEMAALLQGARTVVGLDTGFTHLAAALGRPTLGIYCDHEPGLAGLTGPGPVASLGGKGQVPSRAAVLALAAAGVASRLPGQPAAPLPAGLPPGVLRLHHEDPILSQTRRRVRERGPGGKFTGKVSERTVPTMRIDLDSRLGRAIRIIDDDTGRKDPPRGALLRIVTSPGHVQWVMAVRMINGRLSWRGKERDDPRRAKLRDQQQAEVIQLVDHRSGKPRTVELLASPRSEYFALAIEFAEEFERLQKRVL